MNLSVILLAVIQGISEFLPISSSAHLIIFRDLFSIGNNYITKDIALIFDVSLHFGTLLAIIIYFYKDLFKISISFRKNKIFYNLIIATIPAGIIGVIFSDKIENLIRTNYILIASTLIIVGILIYKIDRHFKNNRSIDDLTLIDAFFIGIFQAFALIPGFSRSGTTLLSGRILKINRTDAAKFSFYISIPIIFGAVLLMLFDKENINLIINNFNIFIIGVGISFIVGLLTINFLLEYIKKHDFKIFMYYRIILGIIVIIYSILR